MTKHIHNRKLINLLLQPVQLKIGLVHVTLSLIFVGGIGIYAYDRLGQITEVVTTLTQADEEVSGLISDYLSSVASVTLVSSLMFILISLAATVWMTHKLVGPTVAFRRLINDLIAGKFGSKLNLRKGDAFTEVAEDLNRLSDVLTKYK